MAGSFIFQSNGVFSSFILSIFFFFPGKYCCGGSLG